MSVRGDKKIDISQFHTQKMIFILSLSFVLFNSFHCSDIPQLEVLFHSSDPDVVWNPSDRLGHNQQLAKHHPRQKVDVAYKKGFPSATDFYSNFVERKRPVIFNLSLIHI